MSICSLVVSHFGFEGGNVVLIVPVLVVAYLISFLGNFGD